jgi:hypothetical protein
MTTWCIRLATLALALLGAGCARSYERYLFRIPRDDGKSDSFNYFRVTIESWALFSQSQFAAGLYDQAAVDSLFGELTGPGRKVQAWKVTARESAAPVAADVSEVVVEATDGSSAPQSVDGSESRAQQKLVVFLGTNSDFLIGQIKGFMQNGAVSAAFRNALLKDKLSEVARARSLASARSAAGEALADRLSVGLVRLMDSQDNLTHAQARDDLMGVLRAALLATDPDDPAAVLAITDAAAAAEWIHDHPDAFDSLLEEP